MSKVYMIIKHDHDGEEIMPIFASLDSSVVDTEYNKIDEIMTWMEKVECKFVERKQSPIRHIKVPNYRAVPDLSAIPKERWEMIVENVAKHNAPLKAKYEAECAKVKADAKEVPSLTEQKKEFAKQNAMPDYILKLWLAKSKEFGESQLEDFNGYYYEINSVELS